MKQTKLLMLAMALGSSCAMAQSVVVVLKDGTQQKFGTDYVKEIVFSEDSGSEDPESLMLTRTDVYSGGNVVLGFSPASEALNVVLDIYGPYTATYLNPGTYTVDPSGAAFTIGNNISYSYVDFVENGNGKVGLQSGTAVVSMSEEDYVYTINMDFVLTDGSQFKGVFEGKIPDYSPGKGLEYVLSNANYNENPQQPGEFYVKFNDAAWSCEMAIDFMSKAGATTLPEGTYTYSAGGGEMTFSSKSYLDTYNPTSNNRFSAGTITVAETDGVYSIEMDLTLEDGRNAKLTYAGSIAGTPTFEQGGDVIEYNLASTQVYSRGNVSFVFSAADGNSEIALDMYGSQDAQYLQTGTYTVAAGGVEFSIGEDARFSYVQNAAGEKTAITAGSAVVSMSEDFVYTIDMDFTLADGSALKGVFKGEIPDYNPGIGMEITLSDAKYNENPQQSGEFYVKFNDAAWSCEMAIDFMSKAGETVLPAGTYTYSAEGGEMTFTGKSYLDTYNPNSNNRFSAGTITVAEADGIYSIEMNLKLENGRDAKITYSGAISGTPAFE